jgi:hypothetical protein
MSVFKAGRVLASDSRWTGEEPDWNNWQSWDTQKFFRTREKAINFYNYYLDAAAMKPMVLDWMKKNGYKKESISLIKEAAPHVLPSTVGKLIRCMERGMPSLHPDADAHFASLPFHDESNPPKPKDDASVVLKLIDDALFLLTKDRVIASTGDKNPIKAAQLSPFDRIKKNVERDIIIPLDSLIDDWAVTSKTPPTLDLPSYLVNNKVPAQGCKIILDWINKNYEEYNSALEKTCMQCVEGFSYLSKPNLRRIVKILEGFMADVKTHANIKNNTRKPRTKKVKNADKQVSRLKYQTNSAEYSIDSISPSRIPTAQRLYTFNTKTRQLNVYYAKGSLGFGVQGTTLNSYDEDSSFGVTLRKPKDILDAILGATPKKLDKLFDGTNLKRKKINGRINAYTIILKVIEHRI